MSKASDLRQIKYGVISAFAVAFVGGLLAALTNAMVVQVYAFVVIVLGVGLIFFSGSKKNQTPKA